MPCFFNKYVYYYSVRVFGNKNFGVFVYKDDHPPPHCHVRFGDQV